MLRFIFPTIIVGFAIGLFLLVTSPMYKDIQALQVKEAAYSQALANEKQLEEKRSELVARYNEFPPEQIERLRKLLPDNVDNIRLILEIDSIAAKYGSSLTNVTFDAAAKKDVNGVAVNEGGQSTIEQNQDFGSFNLAFSMQSSYENYLLFLHDVETSLRIVDISSVTFDSTANENKDLYTYTFKIKTYWLKN